MTLKEAGGTAVVYPAGRPHRVNPHVDGERVVAVMWMQSIVRDLPHAGRLWR
jgi:predicted 2-oxoglutarate/Fe(II)-dependent dioxygenase YbiX